MKKLIALILVGTLFLGGTPEINKTKYTVILKSVSTYLNKKAPNNKYTCNRKITIQ